MARITVVLIFACSLLTAAASTLAAETPIDSPLSAAGSTIYGIHEPNSWHRPSGAPTPDQVASMLQGLGAEAQRWTIPWNQVERNAPVPVLGLHSYNFDDYDSMYQADLAHGIKPLIVVINSPPWAFPSGVPKD